MEAADALIGCIHAEQYDVLQQGHVLRALAQTQRLAWAALAVPWFEFSRSAGGQLQAVLETDYLEFLRTLGEIALLLGLKPTRESYLYSQENYRHVRWLR
eukprot:2283870-Amphidinium_carterae.1